MLEMSDSKNPILNAGERTSPIRVNEINISSSTQT